jgi:DNA integrity scanning protein DisA with diadenylate cyclase activity
MEEIKEALHPLMVEFFKFLAVVVSLLLINILTIIRNSVKDSFIKRRILKWAVNKAIKMEGKEFEKLTNREKWQRLVSQAEKIGITEAVLIKFEAEIMGAVEEWRNDCINTWR